MSMTEELKPLRFFIPKIQKSSEFFWYANSGICGNLHIAILHKNNAFSSKVER